MYERVLFLLLAVGVHLQLKLLALGDPRHARRRRLAEDVAFVLVLESLRAPKQLTLRASLVAAILLVHDC